MNRSRPPEKQFKSLSSMDSELPGSPDQSRARDQSVGCCFDNREEKSLKKDERRPLLLRAALDSPVSTGRGKQTPGVPTRSLCLEKLSDLIGWELHHPSRSGSLCLLASASLTEPIGALFCMLVCFACGQTARFRQNKSTRKLSASAVP